MNFLRYLFLLSIVLYILASCSQATKVEGVIKPIDVEIPKDSKIALVLLGRETPFTHQIKAKVRDDGRFKVNIRQPNLFLVDIDIDIPGVYVTIDSDWLINSDKINRALPIKLVPGERMNIGDFYLSKKFPIEIKNDSNQISSIEELELEWPDIVPADFYGLYINNVAEDNTIYTLYLTADPIFPRSKQFTTISFDTMMTVQEMVAEVPFFRINEELSSGEYIVKVLAIKGVQGGLESVIARSESISIFVK